MADSFDLCIFGENVRIMAVPFHIPMEERGKRMCFTMKIQQTDKIKISFCFLVVNNSYTLEFKVFNSDELNPFEHGGNFEQFTCYYYENTCEKHFENANLNTPLNIYKYLLVRCFQVSLFYVYF